MINAPDVADRLSAGRRGALLEDQTEGAFAGLSMGLTALATSTLLPLLLALLL